MSRFHCILFIPSSASGFFWRIRGKSVRNAKSRRHNCLMWIIDRSLISRRAVQSPLSVKSGLQRANILPPSTKCDKECWLSNLTIYLLWRCNCRWIYLRMQLLLHAAVWGGRESFESSKEGECMNKTAARISTLIPSAASVSSPRGADLQISYVCVVRV